MDRLKTFLREQPLILDAVESALVMLVAFGVNLSKDNETWIVALVVAIFGVGKALTVHPFAPGVIVDLGRAALMLAVSFGLHMSADQVAVIVTFLGTLTTLVVSNRSTPRSDPDPAFMKGLRGQEGETTLSIIGLVIAVIAVLLLILKAVGAFHGLSLIWIIVLLVIGAAVWLFGRRTTV